MDSIKVIIMVTWIGLNVAQGTVSDDDIFMVGNGRCITNGSAALAIIKKINDTDAEHDNNRPMYYTKSESNCTFKSSTTCGIIDLWQSNGWKVHRAIDGPINHYVTDRRWQDFPMYKYNSTSKAHKNVLDLNNLKTFTIPLSVRIERNGIVQISLCDVKDRYAINCYCITMNKTQSSIWKCSSLHDIISYSDDSCEKLDNGLAIKPFLNEDAWTHLSIVRKGTMIQVLRENDVILTWYGEKSIYDNKHLLIYSEGSSLWKLHDYKYLFSETPSTIREEIGPVIHISKNTTCISMFVAMCKACCLKITVSLKKGDEAPEEIPNNISTQDGMWIEKKLIIDTHKYVGHTMSILQYKHQCDGNSNQGQFWAVDYIKLCEEKEYSYIQSDEKKFTCQKIGIGQNDILKIGDNEMSENAIHCPEDTFGKFCVPCSIFGNEKNKCDRFVYCDLDHSEQVCHCTAGNFLDVPSKIEEFEAMSNANSISLKWKEPMRKTGNIIRYDIIYHYWGSREFSCLAHHYKMMNASTTKLNVILKGLKAYSRYLISIRAVTNGGPGFRYSELIQTDQSDSISPEELLAIETFQVISDIVKISVTKIDCENHTGPIYLQSNASCIHEWCTRHTRYNRVRYSVDSNYIYLRGLLPYSNYTSYLFMSRDRKSWIDIGHVTFQTKPSASFPTYGISLLWDDKNDLNITWHHPHHTSGDLRSFEINLQDTKGSQQPIEEFVPVTEANYSRTYTKKVNSTKLQACTEYRASIVVHNKYGASPSKSSSATSPPDIPPNIPIENLETDKTNTTITVHVPSVGSNSTIYQEKIYILVSKAADNDDLVLFEQNLKSIGCIPNLNSSWVVYYSDRTNSPLDFRIGDNSQSRSSFNNPPLKAGTNYSVSIIMSNQCSGMIRLSRAQKYVSTLMKIGQGDEHKSNHPIPEESNGGLWALLLLLIPLIGFGYWYKKYRHQKRSDLLNPYANPENGCVRKHVIWCCTCGGLATILGVLFLAVYFSLRSYTSTLGYFETIPTFVPAILLILTGICVMSLARKEHRYSYLLQICSLFCLGCASTCVLVIITTTSIHMNRLQTLRECVYTQKTRTCTCYSVQSAAHATADDGSRYVFDATPDCEVKHGALYSCLKATIGLSVSGILVCIFSCMLVSQLLRSFYRRQYGPSNNHGSVRGPSIPPSTHCSCCEKCRNPSVPPGPEVYPSDDHIYHYVDQHNHGHESYCQMNNGNNQFRYKNNYENTTEPGIYHEPEATESEVYTSVRNDGQDSSLYDEVLQTQELKSISLHKPDANPMKPVTEDEGYLEPRMCSGQMSTMRCVPFPNSTELEFSTDPCIQLLPRNIYQNGL